LDIKQGDIFWIDFGEPKGSAPGYRHPCIVIQNNVFNASKIASVVVCALTSNLKRVNAPGNVLIRKGEGNLTKDSVINISQIATVDKTDLVEKIGSLSTLKIADIIDGVKLLIEPREVF
jgi:mRNA interferase MazF